ncbi:hypothetical protein ACIQIG_05935 [Streptomyces bacillaris]|uniref:hypothetical protein n=1 Tax=Streptomyces bacillaris TaxID=68179 RepID=UPI0034614F5A
MNSDQRPQPVERVDAPGPLPLPAERDLPPGRHAHHRELLMRRIDLDTPTTTPRTVPDQRPTGPRLRRRLAFTLASALVVGTAAVGITLYDRMTVETMGSSELASWTTSPSRVDTSAGPGAATLKWCLDTMPGEGGPTTVTNADLRGKVTSMIVSRGGDTVLCYVASGNGGFSMAIGDARAVASDVITYDTGGSHGDGQDVFNYASGRVGSDIKAVTLTAQGRTFEVTVDSGRWTAWWPGAGGLKSGVLDTVTLTFTDGTTRSGSASSLLTN